MERTEETRMVKMLLVGELNQAVSDMNNYLSSSFQTQVCLDSYELVKGITKVFQPDIILVSLLGVGELDKRILDYFSTKEVQIPVLLLGTEKECEYYGKYYEKEQYHALLRPTTLPEVMKKCRELCEGTYNAIKVEDKEVIPVKELDRKQRILVVDDSGILLRSVKGMLDKLYDVAVATNGKMAIDKARKFMPDLILLDYQMPGMNGRETLEVMQEDEVLKKIPVVFLTGVAEKNDILSVLKLKPAGYLLKPIENARLLETIETVLADTI